MTEGSADTPEGCSKYVCFVHVYILPTCPQTVFVWPVGTARSHCANIVEKDTALAAGMMAKLSAHTPQAFPKLVPFVILYICIKHICILSFIVCDQCLQDCHTRKKHISGNVCGFSFVWCIQVRTHGVKIPPFAPRNAHHVVTTSRFSAEQAWAEILRKVFRNRNTEIHFFSLYGDISEILCKRRKYVSENTDNEIQILKYRYWNTFIPRMTSCSVTIFKNAL